MDNIAQRMAALGNETRLRIYRLLVRAGESGLNVSDIRSRLEMPASTLSHHLHRLIRVGLVQQERRGTTLICRADYAVMAATFEVFARECCVDDQSACGATQLPLQTNVITNANDTAPTAEKANP